MSYTQFVQAHPELESESEDYKQQCYSEYLQELNGAVDAMEEESY